MALPQSITDYLADSATTAGVSAPGHSDDLFKTGVLDSFALVTVISFVESHLGEEVPPADLTFDNFDTIASICGYVERARAA